MENKILEIINPQTNEKITTAQLLSTVAGSQAAEGMTIAQMRERLAIVDILEASNGTIELDQPQFELLSKIYANHQFGMLHRDLVAVADELEAAANG